jgi:5S rRNA maturation endonuclease (ribonuclease M5)
MMNSPTKINEVLSRVTASLDNVRPAGDGQWSARCPAHDDSNNSLCLSIGDDGRALICCQAGCVTADIVSAVGLTMRDLFPSNGSSGNGNGHAIKHSPQVVAVYQYRDEQGEQLYQVVRFEPKDFRQRKPKSGGGWEWKLGDVRRVIYRLPELRAAIEADANRSPTVFVVEGEKDVDRMRSLGLIATCNSGGASASATGKSKWLPEYSDSVIGCHVVIIGDNDQPGRAHAQAVAKALKDKAASVKILELAGLSDHGDVSDWLDAGHTVDELLSLAAQSTPSRGPNTPHVPVADESNPGITNYDSAPLIMPEIIRRINEQTDSWPRRVDQVLFISDQHGVAWLQSTAEMFGWLHSRTGKTIVWHNKKIGLITREELFAEFRRTCKRYVAVEELPHEPPIRSHFYACQTPEAGDGTAISNLLDRFAPATHLDRDLLLAALATPLWGGGGGQRPAFVVTAESGRGVGKSKVAQIIGHVFRRLLGFFSQRRDGRNKTEIVVARGFGSTRCLARQREVAEILLVRTGVANHESRHFWQADVCGRGRATKCSNLVYHAQRRRPLDRYGPKVGNYQTQCADTLRQLGVGHYRVRHRQPPENHRRFNRVPAATASRPRTIFPLGNVGIGCAGPIARARRSPSSDS